MPRGLRLGIAHDQRQDLRPRAGQVKALTGKLISQQGRVRG